MSEKVISKKRKTHLPNNEISFGIYLFRILKQVHPDMGITKAALNQLNSVINYIGRAINLASVRLLELNGKKTVTSLEVQSSIRALLPGELLKHAVSEATKAVTYYNSSPNPKAEKKKICANVRARIQFSVSKVRKIFTHERIGSGASVYFAAVLDYLSGEILELSGNLARDSKKVRVTTRHIFLAVQADEELKRVFDNLGIVIACGGVVPTLTKVKRQYRKNPDTGKMIAIAGTRALQDIMTQQSKYGTVEFAKAPFERMVRLLIVYFSKPETGLSSDAAIALQVAVEGKTLDIFRNALEISKVSKRQKVTAVDFSTALKIMGVHVNHDYLDKEKEFVVKAAIKRLAHKSGIKLLSSSIYEEVDTFLRGFTSLIVQKSIVSMQNSRRKRVSLNDILFALETIGINLAYAPKKKKATPKPT